MDSRKFATSFRSVMQVVLESSMFDVFLGIRVFSASLVFLAPVAASALTVSWVGDDFGLLSNAFANMYEPTSEDQDSLNTTNLPFTNYYGPNTEYTDAQIDYEGPAGYNIVDAQSMSAQVSGSLEYDSNDRKGFFFVGGASAEVQLTHPGPTEDPPVMSALSAAISGRNFYFQVDTPSMAILSGSIDVLEYDIGNLNHQEGAYQNSVSFDLTDSNWQQELLYGQLTGADDGVSSLAVDDMAYLLPGKTYLFSVNTHAELVSDPTTSSDFGSSHTFADLFLDIVPIPVPPALWCFGSGLLGLLGIARRKAAQAESVKNVGLRIIVSD